MLKPSCGDTAALPGPPPVAATARQGEGLAGWPGRSYLCGHLTSHCRFPVRPTRDEPAVWVTRMCLADAQIDLPRRAALLAARDYAQNSRIWTALVLKESGC